MRGFHISKVETVITGAQLVQGRRPQGVSPRCHKNLVMLRLICPEPRQVRATEAQGCGTGARLDNGGCPEGIVLRQMIICADDSLILGCTIGSIEGIVGTTADRRVRRRNKLLQQFGRDRIVTARWELNVTRGKAGIPWRSSRATCNGK